MKLFLTILCSIIICISSFAQQTLPMTANFQNAYNRQTRSLNGAPGAKYWQNRADYDLKVSFDPATRLVKGTTKIVYKNSSPDTLNELWFKLYTNLYMKGYAPKSFNKEDLGAGMTITSFTADKKAKDTSSLITDGTNMHTAISPLLPGKSITLNIEYYYTLNKGSHMRTGQVDSGSAFIAYFFPRIAVYDDIDGWNKYPYRGSEEFYNDFCNFKAAITVPKNFVVWATGDLQNAKSVFNSTIAKRMKNAAKNDDIVYVIDSTDLAKGGITKQKDFNTWRYEAKDVTDLVFALSDHYLWQSTSLVVDPKTGRRTRVDAAYNPIHKDYYEVINFARKTVESMSYKFPAWPYPYNHETVFDGLDQMEYPMMVNDNPTEKREDGITLTDHEIFHTMFPFYMGINETKYGWMDEGWATIGEWLISPMIDSTIKDDYGIAATAKTSGEKADVPIMTLTTDLMFAAGFTDSYPKPAFGYLYVKDYLGDSLFTVALHHYIEQWHGRHPTPYDFFNSMNEGSGKNLNWFWKRWFFEGGALDLGIAAVAKNAAGYTITIENKSNKPLPVDLLVTYTDGTQETTHHSMQAWQLENKTINMDIITGKTIKNVKLGAFYTPDKNPKDNEFKVN